MTPRGARRLALLFFVASAGLTLFLIRRPSVVFLVGSAAMGSAAYVLVARRIPHVKSSGEVALLPAVARRRIVSLVASGFFVFSGFSLLAVLQHPLAKTLTYYGLIAAAAACVTICILLAEPGWAVRSNLAMIVIQALNVFGSDQLLFPNGIAGSDMPVHVTALINPILQTGHIPALDPCGFFYVTFPGQHVLVGSLALVSGWPVTATYESLGFLVMCIPILTAFLIGRRLFGERAGLFAALILTGSSYYIYWASHDSTLTFTLPYLALLLLVAFVAMDRMRLRIYVVMAILLVAVVLTHPYSSAVLVFLVVAIVAGQLCVDRNRRTTVWPPRILGAMTGASVLLYWSNYTCLMSKSLVFAQSYYRVILSEAIVAPPAVYDALPLRTIFLNTIGDSLLQVIVVVGLFLLLSRRLDGRGAVIVAATVGLFALAAAGVFTRLTYLLPNRVYVFLQAFGLAPLAAIALRDLPSFRFRSTSRVKQLAVAGVVVGLVFSFTFASAASTIAGFETSPFVGSEAYTKLWGTDYESDSAAWVCANIPVGSTINASRSLFELDRLTATGCVGTNGTRLSYVSYRLISPTGFVSVLDPSGIRTGSYVWFSSYDVNPGYQAHVIEFGRSGSVVYNKLEASSIVAYSPFDKVYDAGRVQIYWAQG